MVTKAKNQCSGSVSVRLVSVQNRFEGSRLAAAGIQSFFQDRIQIGYLGSFPVERHSEMR